MRTYQPGLYALLACAIVGSRSDAGGPDYLTATLNATLDLSREVRTLQHSFATIPGPPQGRGLYNQADKIQMDLANLEVLLTRKVARDAVYSTYAQADSKVNRLLDDLQGIATWDPAVRMAARRVRDAQQDLHFALSGGDTAPARVAELVHGQTLLLHSRVEDLEGLVRFALLNQQPSLRGWKEDFDNLRKSVAALQRAEQDKSTREDLKKQLHQTDKAWNHLVVRYRALPEGQYAYVRHAFAQVDRVLERLATLLGVTDKRAPLNEKPAP
jgi:hypothetical protein